jgi:hypothetical protein
MENKILIAMAIVSSCVAIFSPVADHKYQPHKKDGTTIKAERYLHDLEQKNNRNIEDLKHDVDSLLILKKKIKYIYINKKDSL